MISEYRNVRRGTVALVFLGWFSVGQASTLKISAESKTRSQAEVEADYTTSHIFLNETTADSVPITIFFDPGMLGVETAEVFSNLNRRDRATGDANHDGIEDGILVPAGNN